MKKTNTTIGIIGLLLVVTSCIAEVKLFRVDDFKTGVITGKARGTIFNDYYPSNMLYVSDVDSSKRWTPNQTDIELAEKILRQQITGINKNRPNQMDGCPIIHKRLNSYFRQYVVIKNTKDQRLIHINFYWDRHTIKDRLRGNSDMRLDYSSDYAVVFDGCSNFWSVNVNLDDNELTDFRVNGVG
ncbi:MAG TPA: hypothetical protein VKY45_00230 [Marinilabiliaceae bacterium]|nr:hypothetical protein [Marinilabiliaceae bacterium]